VRLRSTLAWFQTPDQHHEDVELVSGNHAPWQA
jgi:hypothetical protein